MHRLPDFPDLPTVAETLPGFAAGGWQGMVAPLGTPAAAIQKINESLRKVLSEPNLAKQLGSRGAYVDPMSPSEVNTFINTAGAMASRDRSIRSKHQEMMDRRLPAAT